MAKHLKLKIKNEQLAKVAGLGKLKGKPSSEKKEEEKGKKGKAPAAGAPVPEEEKPRRIRAKTKSDFAPKEEESEEAAIEQPEIAPAPEVEIEETPALAVEPVVEAAAPVAELEPPAPIVEEKAPPPPPAPETPPVVEKPKAPPKERLGPTGRHIKDLLPPKKEKPPATAGRPASTPPASTEKPKKPGEEEDWKKGKKVREFKDVKPVRRDARSFDGRDRKGLGEGEDEKWRKKRAHKTRAPQYEEPVLRPTSLKIRLPISIKDLAVEMKLKSSELVQKLFMQGVILTLNDFLDDETTVQFLGSEFGCEITIDTAEEDRIQITKKTIQEEIKATDPNLLVIRPPVVTFMGHVDHGKTSLIDAIRKSNIAGGEAGAITQHIGAFRCKTPVGDLTILDTPGHEAFSSMRTRGAEVTDIVVLVVAGDEGMREQTLEALAQAKAANVTIVVAINKCDKPGFNVENVYRQLSEVELLPEAWGGKTITINTSAMTGQGIQELLEMLALQAEVLELKANPQARARGTVLESEMHKGMGAVTTVLVQNGTLKTGDAIVFDQLWGKVKTMQDEHGAALREAPPSTPVKITGLSGLPEAGDPFIVVKNEREARDIAETRAVGQKQMTLQQKKAPVLESLMKKEGKVAKKLLKLIIRGDVQGSVEALKTSLMKIHSDKVDLEIIAAGVGEITESDAELASASNAVILGFHTQVESHASGLIKELGVTLRLHDIIYHAIEDVKVVMTGLLDKIEEEKEIGKAEVKAVFKASQLGNICGCQVTEGSIFRNNRIRVVRGGQIIWRGGIASLKRIKEDVREVKKGFECGILLDGFNEAAPGDILQAYEITYRAQEL